MGHVQQLCNNLTGGQRWRITMAICLQQPDGSLTLMNYLLMVNICCIWKCCKRIDSWRIIDMMFFPGPDIIVDLHGYKMCRFCPQKKNGEDLRMSNCEQLPGSIPSSHQLYPPSLPSGNLLQFAMENHQIVDLPIRKWWIFPQLCYKLDKLPEGRSPFLHGFPMTFL